MKQSDFPKDNSNPGDNELSSDDTVPKQRMENDNSNEVINNNKDNTNIMSENPVMQPLLAYVAFSMNSGSIDSIWKAVLGHFTLSQIVEAKNVLWHIPSINELIGEKIARKNSLSS